MTARLLLALATALLAAVPAAEAAAPFCEKVDIFEEGHNGFVSYRIPGIVVTAKGTVLAYCEARKFTPADRGELEIHLRRSTDGGRTWSPQQQIAHLGPRLPRNPHMPDDKKRRDMGGPEQQTCWPRSSVWARRGTRWSCTSATTAPTCCGASAPPTKAACGFR